MYLSDASKVVVAFPDLFTEGFPFVRVVSQHLEPIGFLDVVVGGLVPQHRQAEDLVVVLVLSLLGVQAPQVLEVVFEVGFLFTLAFRLGVLWETGLYLLDTKTSGFISGH